MKKCLQKKYTKKLKIKKEGVKMTSKIDLTNISGKNKFRENCEKATEFIESCFDENNPDDDLTFDERIESRVDELPAPVRNIVCASQRLEPPTCATDDELEEIEECECKETEVAPRDLLKMALDSKQLYLDKHRELKTEKARLRLETDWSKVIEGRPNPNDADKKEWITFQTHELQEEVDDLKCEADYLWELWELEKIMLRKQ